MSKEEFSIKAVGFCIGFALGIWLLSKFSPVFGGSIKSTIAILFGVA